MKLAVLTLLPIALAGGIARAQDANDPIAQQRACSQKTRPDQLECLDKLSRASASLAPSVPNGSRWITSVTTSPVDYSPIATATTSSLEGRSSSEMQLSIRCRGGRTELAVAGLIISGHGEDYVVSYRVNGSQPVQVAAAPGLGTGVAFKSDTAGLVRSLPGEGEFAVHLTSRVGVAQDATFSLVGLEIVREKIAAACKWPRAEAKPDT
jgi:hypothetical protein